MNIPEATKLPIKADKTDQFISTFVYSLPERPGLYRRVGREGRVGLTPGEGKILAIAIGDKQGQATVTVCEMVRWHDGERLLRPLLMGVESPSSEDKDGPPF